MTTWEELRPWSSPIGPTDQVVIVAMTGGAKSTLAATLTLGVRSLVVIDSKARLTLPGARVVELPQWDEATPAQTTDALAAALRWREPGSREGNRVILRPHAFDADRYDAHEPIFRAIFLRGGPAVVWVDEVTATGATPNRIQPAYRALSARGRTRGPGKPPQGIGLLSLTQAPYGLLPPILRRNAEYTIYGPIEPGDARDIPREGIEVATSLPTKEGHFVLYHASEREPYRLYVPIPPALRTWEAP